MTQALHLMNTQALQEKITNDSGRVARWVTDFSEPTNLLEVMYLTVYSRKPSDLEIEQLLPLLEVDDGGRKTMVANLLWAMLNSPEFMYED